MGRAIGVGGEKGVKFSVLFPFSKRGTRGNGRPTVESATVQYSTCRRQPPCTCVLFGSVPVWYRTVPYGSIVSQLYNGAVLSRVSIRCTRTLRVLSWSGTLLVGAPRARQWLTCALG